MQSEAANQRPQLMRVSREAIPGALSKAETYRFLNQPWQAESICRDVLSIDPANEEALILLLLCLTDQFEQGVIAKEALQIAEGLPDEYHRAYYSGLVRERQAIAIFRRHHDYRCRLEAYSLFQNAMELYRQARALSPPDNDDSVLRWNACVRFLERNWGLH
jgi:tetratricopeptide (TPR) repeat protein